MLAAIRDETLRAKVLEIFAGEPALHCTPTAEAIELVRFAVIKLALRGPKELALAAKFYAVDTRDLLVSAEFGQDPRADEAWVASMLEGTDA